MPVVPGIINGKPFFAYKYYNQLKVGKFYNEKKPENEHMAEKKIDKTAKGIIKRRKEKKFNPVSMIETIAQPVVSAVETVQQKLAEPSDVMAFPVVEEQPRNSILEQKKIEEYDEILKDVDKNLELLDELEKKTTKRKKTKEEINEERRKNLAKARGAKVTKRENRYKTVALPEIDEEEREFHINTKRIESLELARAARKAKREAKEAKAAAEKAAKEAKAAAKKNNKSNKKSNKKSKK